MRRNITLIFKVIFFLFTSALFSIPTILFLTLRHGGIAGGTSAPGPSVKTDIIFVFITLISVCLIVLTGWSLFISRSDKNKRL